jgi:hypothetical protein
MIPSHVTPEFRAWLRAIGRPSNRTAEEVYALWKEYAQTCTNYDQSPVQSEFEQWYSEPLKLNNERRARG